MNDDIVYWETEWFERADMTGQFKVFAAARKSDGLEIRTTAAITAGDLLRNPRPTQRAALRRAFEDNAKTELARALQAEGWEPVRGSDVSGHKSDPATTRGAPVPTTTGPEGTDL